MGKKKKNKLPLSLFQTVLWGISLTRQALWTHDNQSSSPSIWLTGEIDRLLAGTALPPERQRSLLAADMETHRQREYSMSQSVRDGWMKVSPGLKEITADVQQQIGTWNLKMRSNIKQNKFWRVYIHLIFHTDVYFMQSYPTEAAVLVTDLRQGLKLAACFSFLLRCPI